MRGFFLGGGLRGGSLAYFRYLKCANLRNLNFSGVGFGSPDPHPPPPESLPRSAHGFHKIIKHIKIDKTL